MRTVTLLAALAGIIGLVLTTITVVGALTGPEVVSDSGSPDGSSTDRSAEPATGTGTVSAATVSQLSDGVQLSRFEGLLGEPLRRDRLGEYLQTTWASTDVAVVAYSDTLDQVVAFTLTALSPDFNPLVEYVTGGVRLGSSVFADIGEEAIGVSGLYPPNGQWSYAELYGGGFATDYKQVVLAASWTSTAADDLEATELLDLVDCMPYSIHDREPGCEASRVEPLRRGLRVTSMTVGESGALEAVTQEGMSFFAVL